MKARPRTDRAPGVPGAATLVSVDELKARAASADQEGRERLNKRLRAAFLEGAEEDSRRRLGRGLTVEELERVLRRYPGDADDDERQKIDGSRRSDDPCHKDGRA